MQSQNCLLAVSEPLAVAPRLRLLKRLRFDIQASHLYQLRETVIYTVGVYVYE